MAAVVVAKVHKQEDVDDLLADDDQNERLPLSGPLLPKGSMRSIFGSDSDTAEMAKNLWSNDGIGLAPSSPDGGTLSLISQSPRGGDRRKTVSQVRRRSIAPSRENSVAADNVQDALVLEHLSGETDLFADPQKALLLDGVWKETLSQVQKTSMYFHGFTDGEVEQMFPFLTHFPFSHGDMLAQQGEEATWCGVLLAGQLEAINTGTKELLGKLSPGAIVGEMALFRGGTRYCDIVGRGSGAIACLLFEQIPEMVERTPALALKLIAVFGRAAASKFILTQPPPQPRSKNAASGSGSNPSSKPGTAAPGTAEGKKRGAPAAVRPAAGSKEAAELAMRYRAAAQSLQRRGLLEAEANELLRWLILDEFPPNAVLLQEGRHLHHVAVVLAGTVAEGERVRGVGELVGAWAAVSRHPQAARVVGGKEGGTVGYLQMTAVEEMGKQKAFGTLALKTLKLMGIAATSTKEQDGLAPVSSPLLQVGSKLTEVLFRNKVKETQASAAISQEERDKAMHDKHRNEILLKKLQRAHDALTSRLGSMETVLSQKDKEIQRLQLQLKQKDKEGAAMLQRAASLSSQLDAAYDSSSQMQQITNLHETIQQRDSTIVELQEQLEEAGKETDLVLLDAEGQYKRLQEDSYSLHRRTAARHRLRMFILLIVLDCKRRSEKKHKTKAAVLSWISGKAQGEASMSVASLNLELEAARTRLDQASEEGEKMREAAENLAQSKTLLEARQQELITTAKQALGRDQQLEGAAKFAEERMEAAVQRAESLSNECHHLRWAVSQGEERLKEMAEECAQLVAERDVAASELVEVRQAERGASRELEGLRKRVVDLEAALFSERKQMAGRMSEADRQGRQAYEASHELHRLQEELRIEHAARAAERVSHEKQRVLLARLLELESTFGAMLMPPSGGAPTGPQYLSPYGVALHELAKEEMRIPSSVRERPTPASNLPPPLLARPLPGHEARLAVRAAASHGAAHDPTSHPRGAADGVGHSNATVRGLPGSTSLPLLRTGIRTPISGAKPLPVARGSARVQQRRSGGISVGSGVAGTETQALAHAVQSRVRP